MPKLFTFNSKLNLLLIFGIALVFHPNLSFAVNYTNVNQAGELSLNFGDTITAGNITITQAGVDNFNTTLGGTQGVNSVDVNAGGSINVHPNFTVNGLPIGTGLYLASNTTATIAGVPAPIYAYLNVNAGGTININPVFGAPTNPANYFGIFFDAGLGNNQFNPQGGNNDNSMINAGTINFTTGLQQDAIGTVSTILISNVYGDGVGVNLLNTGTLNAPQLTAGGGAQTLFVNAIAYDSSGALDIPPVPPLSLTNTGTINGNISTYDTAESATSPFTINNNAGGNINGYINPYFYNLTLSNSGTITGTTNNFPNNNAIGGFTPTTNSGATTTAIITNNAAGIITGPGNTTANAVIRLQDYASNNSSYTVTNNGTVSSTQGSSGFAIQVELTTGPTIINLGANSTVTGIINSSSNTNPVTLNVGGTFTMGGSFTNIKTINQTAGTLSMNASNITGFNTFTISNGATTNLANTYSGTTTTNNGIINLNTNITTNLSNNSGSTLNANGTRTITGNNTLAANSTLGLSITTPLIYDSLNVTGVTSISPTSTFAVTVNNNASGLANGNTFIVYFATTPPTLPQVTSNRYTFTPSVIANNIVLTLSGIPAPPPPSTAPNFLQQLAAGMLAQSPLSSNIINLARTAESILNNSTLVNQPIGQFFQIISNLPFFNDIEGVLNELAFNQNSNTLLTSNSMVTSTLTSLQQLFNFFATQNAAEFSNANNMLGRAPTKIPEGYVAGDVYSKRLSIGSLFYGSTEKQNVSAFGSYPYTSNIGGLGIVTAACMNEYYNLGLGLAYVSDHTRMKNLNASNNIQSTKINSYQLSILNTFYLPNNLLDLSLNVSVARNNVQQSSLVFVDPAFLLKINSRYYIYQTQAQVIASRYFYLCDLCCQDNINSSQGKSCATSSQLYLIPSVSFNWNNQHRPAYDDNPSIVAQTHSKLRYDLSTYSVGFSLAKYDSNICGDTVGEYEAHINYFGTLRNKTPQEISQFQAGGPAFVLVGLKPFANTVNLGGSLSVPLGCNFRLFTLYDLNVRKHYSNNALTLKISWDFI